MRLAIASVDAFPKMGGVSTMAHHLANAFVDLGHEVVFVGPKGTYVPRDYVRHYELVEDWESNPSAKEGEGALVEDRRVRSLFDTVIERYSVERVLLVHPFYYGPGAMEAAHAAGIPCSAYFHGFELRSQLGALPYPEDQADVVSEKRRRSFRDRLLCLIAGADELLVNSRYTASLFEHLQHEGPVRVTGVGIPDSDLERELDLTPGYHPETKKRRREALGLPEQACGAYVGRLVPSKRVDRLLRLCREAPGLGAVLIGDGPEAPRLRQLTRRWGLESKVVFAGRVDEEHKWALLRASDFCCLLSEPDDERGHVEGFGIALLEGAAAAAVPVSSGTGGMKDVVDHRNTGLVVPEDDAEAGSLLERMAADPDEMSELSTLAREQLRSRYTWSAVASYVVAGWQQ